MVSRSGYVYDMDDQWALIRWRGVVASSIRGKRGQALLRDLVDALEAMPKRELIAHELECQDGVCALGAAGRARGLDMSELDPDDIVSTAAAFDIAEPLAREIVYENDEAIWRCSPAERYDHMLAWAKARLRSAPLPDPRAALTPE